MAKTETKKAEPKKYYISDKIVNEGYYGFIDGCYFIVDPQEIRLVKRGGGVVPSVTTECKCWQGSNFDPAEPGVLSGLDNPGSNFFVDLTDEQVNQLTIARVLK